PKRPQDRIELPNLKTQFMELLEKPIGQGGYGKAHDELGSRYGVTLGNGNGSAAGGGGQQSESLPAINGNGVTAADTSVWTETEMINNRPTPDRVSQVPDAGDAAGQVSVSHGDVLI